MLRKQSTHKDRDRSLLRANVYVYSFDAEKVKTIHEFYGLSIEDRVRSLIDKGHNLVVDAGSNHVCKLIVGSSSDYFDYCGVGSSTTAAAAGQTDLQTPIARTAVTSVYDVSNEAHLDTFFGSGTGNGTWNEVGIFTASSSGVMLARRVLASAFVKSTSNTAVVTWTITLTPV